MKRFILLSIILILATFNITELMSNVSIGNEETEKREIQTTRYSDFTQITRNSIKIINNRKLYTNAFIETVNDLKKHEGFKAKPYRDINGHLTIGWGFVVHYIPAKFRNSITREQADSILNAKVKFNVVYAKEQYPNLNDFQALAIAHLAYNKGFGRIKKHPLHTQLKNGVVNYNTLVYFSKYEKNRNNFKEARQFEVNLFKLKYQL